MESSASPIPAKRGTSAKMLLLLGLLALGVGLFFLPRLVRRIDSAFGLAWEKGTVYEAQYREMTNAYVVASEAPSSHPARQLYDLRHAALMEAGYIVTRELSFSEPFPNTRAVNRFVSRFGLRFRGVEFALQPLGSNQSSVIKITARKSDFGAFGPIEQFIRHYNATE